MKENIRFKQIYQDHSGMVNSLALSYLQNKEDAEEIAQDVFIKVYDKLFEFRNESSLKTWIYRITINHCLDFLKAKNRNKRSVFSKSSNLSEIDKANFEHPGIILEKKEMASILLTCINSLPQKQKTAFLLSKMDGMKQEEIAKIMKKSVSGIESLIFRAKQNLKKMIELRWIQQQEF